MSWTRSEICAFVFIVRTSHTSSARKGLEAWCDQRCRELSHYMCTENPLLSWINCISHVNGMLNFFSMLIFLGLKTLLVWMHILFTCFCCSLQHVAACLYTNYTTICKARLVMHVPKKSIHFWLGGMHILVNMECCCCFVFWEVFFYFFTWGSQKNLWAVTDCQSTCRGCALSDGVGYSCLCCCWSVSQPWRRAKL